MTKRISLKEAAEAVLKGSATAAQPSALPVGNGKIVELGGSSNKKPEGDEVGKKASANASKTSHPAGEPAVGQEPSHLTDIPPQPQNSVTAKVQPPFATPSGASVTPHPVMQQTEEAAVEGEQVETPSTETVVDAPAKTEAEIAEELEARKALVKEKFAAMSIDEDMKAMFVGQEFSEEFLSKAKTIFEAAVISRAVAVIEEVEKGILAAAEESVEEIKEELEAKADAYLTYVAEEWKKENAVAIEAGLKTEITEGFIGALRNLFLEHDMDVPEEKVSIVESLTEQVSNLETQINETLNKNIELTNKISQFSKKDILNTVCEGLTATQAEKIKTLAESVEFTTEGEYTEKLNVIREQYFSTTVKKPVPATVVNDEPIQLQEESNASPEMKAIAAAISKTVRK